ncbi:MAG: type IV toxin-antitoxin system AbiEi family antitoxin domain-containing protein [Actinomycetota bacterium]|nr:type IV toxin-antitoxin system AbiEi family antitoxin domain-containing protein [Actinomycetota bacterium]
MLDQRIAELASRQYGLFSRPQILQLGVTERIIHRRLQSGRWRQLAPGVYSLPGFPATWRRSLWLGHSPSGRRPWSPTRRRPLSTA